MFKVSLLMTVLACSVHSGRISYWRLHKEAKHRNHRRLENQVGDIVRDWSNCPAVFYKSSPPDVNLDASSDPTLICHRCPEKTDKSWDLPGCGGASKSVCERFKTMCLNDAEYDQDGACKSKACPTCRACETPHWKVPSYHRLKKDFHHPSNEFLAVDFDGGRGIARWLAYRINSRLFPSEDTGSVQRTTSFYNDPHLGSEGLGSSNYSNQPSAPVLGNYRGYESPYVKGHIGMNREFAWGAAPELASNFYSNIAPQLKIANHPAWYHGCESELLDKIGDPDNEEYEFYIVSGASGALKHASRKSAMQPDHYPKKGWKNATTFLNAIPAFWWKAFIKVDRYDVILESGGWIGENSHVRRKGKNEVEVNAYESLEKFEQALRKRCGGCKVEVFPGVDHSGRTAVVSPKKPAYDCISKDSCNGCVHAHGGNKCKWCPAAIGQGGKCVQTDVGRLNSCFFHTGWPQSIKEANKCTEGEESAEESETLVADIPLPNLSIRCHYLKKVSACGELGVNTPEACEGRCRTHGVGMFDFSHYRCVWDHDEQICKNGAKVSQPTTCADDCGTLEPLTATAIWGMSSDELETACKERGMRSDGVKSSKQARLRVRECIDVLTDAAIQRMKKADLQDACLARDLDATGKKAWLKARLKAFDGDGLRCSGH